MNEYSWFLTVSDQGREHEHGQQVEGVPYTVHSADDPQAVADRLLKYFATRLKGESLSPIKVEVWRGPLLIGDPVAMAEWPV